MPNKYLPILDWGRTYTKRAFSNDLTAATIVTVMLIPQSLAYALLAGLPPEAGIYASILPIILYSVLGSSRALAVGPVALVSLMTAAALGQVQVQGEAGYVTAALTLALLSGLFLVGMGLLRLGFLANFLSHSVIAGFITASGILIAVSQLKHVLGITASGHNLPEILLSLGTSLAAANWITFTIGASATLFLYWVRKGLKPALTGLGLNPSLAATASKAAPVSAIAVSTTTVWYFGLEERGVLTVGDVPQSLPPLTMPSFSPDLISQLAVPALLISVIGFVESVSVAQTLAAKKRQRIAPDQELIGLGAANIGAAFTGGFPVTGGFSRSVVNFDAGAETPAAGALTAAGLAVAAVTLTPLIKYLPNAVLAATIIVAVLSLVDFSVFKKTWTYSRADFSAVMATVILTLGFGVETGVSAGVFLSVLLHILKTARPHVAEVGLVPGTHHFRNIDRHAVETAVNVVTLRVDESLYFVNARFLEELVMDRIACDQDCHHVVLMFSAVNEVDFSALESLEELNHRLTDLGIGLHLSEVKGPVMDRLQSSSLTSALNGQVFMSQWDAWAQLTSADSPNMQRLPAPGAGPQHGEAFH